MAISWAMTVLTVDDNPSMRVLFKAVAPLGLETIEAQDGQEALNLLQQADPDLIVLDVNMPVLDGQGTLEMLRKTPATRNIPVLMLTADSREDLICSLLRLGVTDYLVKPFNRSTLIHNVSRILKVSIQ